MRFELLEALLRVAITMRDNEGQEALSPAEKVSEGFALRRAACRWWKGIRITSCVQYVPHRMKGEI